MSKLAEFKEMFQSAMTPDEIIMAIFSKLESRIIPKDPKIIHTAIYELKKDPNYGDLLEQFKFDCSGLYPFSDLLDRVIFRIESTCIISTHNPKYEKYELPKDTLLKVFNSFSKAKQEKILSMAEKFEKMLPC